MTVYVNQTVHHYCDEVELGYGALRSHVANLTVRAEDILNFYHENSPGAPIMFDRLYTSGLGAL
ncbi:hypothetical protein N7468_009970 [Penicillium chermesinum]|uniref:Uncharacterized protein n=1 Tax=Penicillium chermesinum TaxID=63820 RepID=A0A9W9TBT4_9EURO|nr:uncharacterized protein N7468_009970 [Penicillium chermesinum]KAJ5216962.1 hypothetical protein N7468_009970 [Penicillium chermesinum]KAJ6171424.1 hypothetical protein N7470_000491 [Penicillium chermesinum]